MPSHLAHESSFNVKHRPGPRKITRIAQIAVGIDEKRSMLRARRRGADSNPEVPLLSPPDPGSR
jgi:hypothetical protein